VAESFSEPSAIKAPVARKGYCETLTAEMHRHRIDALVNFEKTVCMLSEGDCGRTTATALVQTPPQAHWLVMAARLKQIVSDISGVGAWLRAGHAFHMALSYC